jgi:two-component system response regulator RegX3
MCNAETTTQSVLIVDDDFDTMDMLAQLLRDHGYAVFTAVDRDEAISVFSANNVDIVLMDYMMPGMSAIRFLNNVSSLRPRTRVILTTAGNRVQMVARMLGLRDYVAKPFDEQKLFSVLQQGNEEQ